MFWTCSFENFISYLRTSYLAWKSVIPSFSKVFRVLLMWNFILVAKSEFMLKELLNFQSPLPLFSSLPRSRENSKGEWLVEKTVNTYVLLTNSCSRLVTKQTSLLWINLDIWKKKCLILGFWTLHISHKLNFSLIWIIFSNDFFFKHGFPPKLVRLISNITLRSPPITIFLFWISFTLPKILTRSERVFSCSYSVLVL